MSTAKQARLARIERGIENFGSRCRSAAAGTPAKTSNCSQHQSLLRQKEELEREIEAERAESPEAVEAANTEASEVDPEAAGRARRAEEAMLGLVDSHDEDGKPTITAKQAVEQAAEKTEDKKPPEARADQQTEGALQGDISTKSTASAIGANTPGSLNTGTGGQKTDVAYIGSRGHPDPLSNIYEAIDKMRERTISFIPKANAEINAIVLHVETVTNADPAVRTTAAGSNKAVGTHPGTDKTPQRWFKCYCIVDFYTSCLPLPLMGPMPPIDTSSMKQCEIETRAKSVGLSVADYKNRATIASYPDIQSILRVSRFPYFLGRADRVEAPQVGQTIKVKYLDDDNFSYGVYIGPVTDSQETTTSDKNKDKASTSPVADPRPLLSAFAQSGKNVNDLSKFELKAIAKQLNMTPSEARLLLAADAPPPTAAEATTSVPTNENGPSPEAAPEPVSTASPAEAQADENPEPELGPWTPYLTKEIGLEHARIDIDELKERLGFARTKCADTNRSERARTRWCNKVNSFLTQIEGLEDKIRRILAHG
jgi:hypothetical protein